MTVYVDDFRVQATVGRIRGGRWSHLVTDNPSIEELHAFAARIGLRREWFQTGKHAYRPHYDVTDAKRLAAIAAGAVPISYWEMPAVLKRARDATKAKEATR